MLEKYELKSTTKRYNGALTNNANTFDNVTDLILSCNVLNEKCDYRFSNVTSLTLRNDCLRTEHMEPLKRIVNLFNLKHLDFPEFVPLSSSQVLLEILKEALQLSSMAIDSYQLISLCDDNIELGNYLNKMIKTLNLDYTDICWRYNYLEEKDKFCRIFSNLEQLIYIANAKNERNGCDKILYLLNHLPKLSKLDTYTRQFVNDRRWCSSRFKNKAKKLNIISCHKPYYDIDSHLYRDCLRVWTG